MKKILLLLYIIHTPFLTLSQSSYSISGYIKTPEGEALEGVRINCSNVLLPDWTDADGFYQFENLVEGQSYEIKPISPTGNLLEGVTILDVMKIRCYLLGGDTLSLIQRIAADVSSLTEPSLFYFKVDRFDIASTYFHLIDYYSNFNNVDNNSFVYLPEAYQIPPLGELETDTTVVWLEDRILIDSLTQDLLHQNFIGIKRGDVVSEEDFLLDALEQTAFYLSHTATCSTEATVGFYAEDTLELAAFQYSLSWDTEVIRFDSLKNIHPKLGDSDIWYNTEEADNGLLSFAWISLEEEGIFLTPDLPLFELQFEVIGQQGDSSPISFVEDPLKFQIIGPNCSLTNPSFSDGSVSIEFVPANCGEVAYPLPNFTAPDTICVGACFELTDLCQAEAQSWLWTMEGANISSDTSPNPGLICYDAPGTYQIEQQIQTGFCTSIYIESVEVVSPSIQPAYDPIQRLCDAAVLVDATSPNALQYLWDNGSTNPVRQFTEEGTYTLTLWDAYCRQEDSIQVQQCGKVYIPNSFSPNGDGINDKFEVFSFNAEIQALEIYNRWGALVHSGLNWNGAFKGQEAQKGIYIYVLTYLDLQNQQIVVLTGDVLLLR